MLLVATLSVVLLSKPSFSIFVSIDCGSSSSFIDENSIKWTGDDGYVHNGVSQVVDSYYAAGQVLSTLKSFLNTEEKLLYHH